ncbi:MAG: hypothetical protein WBF88_17495 [Pusillimonas sp.]
MKHDSSEWRALRNQKLAQWIGDPNAVAFLLDVFNVGEVWDDLIDQDKPVSADDINKAFYTALITLPGNPFYRAHMAQLAGVMVSGIHAWLDANKLEKGDANDKAYAYVLRVWYMELITLVAQLLHGFDYVRSVSVDIRHFFTHETLDEYIGELP